MPTDQQIEPGVLTTFRLFTGAMAVLQVARLLVLQRRGTADLFVALTAALMGLLFLYLSLPSLRAALGRLYLPIALCAAAVGPILADGLATRAVGPLVAEPARLYFWLVPPLVLICAQYGVRALLLFTIGTALLPVLLLVGGSGGALALFAASSGGLARLFLFSLAGFLIIQISGAQRAQRRELAERNRQLAQFASAQEQLAVSRERNRLARELHDTLAHTLSALSVQLTAFDVLLTRDPAAARAALPALQQLARDGLHESRRALQALRAHPIETLGLLPALRRLAEQTGERGGLTVRAELPAQLPPLRPEVEQQLFRIAEEALNNSLRHAQARQVSLTLAPLPGLLRLSVGDDGVGFEVAAVEREGRFGLRGMRERAALIAAALKVESQPQRGTTVVVELPLGEEGR